MEQILTLFVLCGVCVFVTSLPIKDDQSVERLMSLIKQLKSMEKHPRNIHWYNPSKIENNHQTNMDTSDEHSGILYNSLNSDFDSPVKRQGGWSYDYGLGGGRFGKRNYGDYGIGGSRFGRDVDHVDLADGVLDGA
ncbi:hypothetical protein SNE40_023136 [Patella caerulea]|uniref:Uncharacterized protein n=1 Tax=Patella caerulea TaxID=87958 RepID=A0AAN8FXU6_PATCE